MQCITILTLLAIVVAANSQSQLRNYYSDYNSSTVRTDDYVNANRYQYALNIWFYDYQIENFKELYLQQIETIKTQKEFLKNVIAQTFERLYPLSLLSDFSKACVNKYISLVPSLAYAESSAERCYTTAYNQLNSLITYAAATNRTLQTYYSNTFEREVLNCGTKFNESTSLNYTLCITSAVLAANTYTINNQKTFNSQIDTARNNARIYVKTAVECNFSLTNGTTSSISRCDTMVDRCLHGLDNCNQCQGYFCPTSYDMKSYEISYTNQTMRNPFYNVNGPVDCLTLRIY